MADPRSATAFAATLALACASAPTAEPRVVCPAAGPRAEPRSVVSAPGDAQRGSLAFARGCAGCHASAPGQREPGAPAHAPRLDCAEWLASVSDAYLYDAINRGPGAYGHGGLAPLGEHLSPAEIADLVAYLRSLNPAGSAPTIPR